MANFGSALANFGLMSQGSAAADKAVQDREFEAQRIESQRRANAAADQQAELAGQRIRTGSMAEKEMQRQAGAAEAYRTSTQGLGLDASEAAQLEARRTTALGLGDLPTALSAGEAKTAGAERAKLWLANQAQIGADPKAVSEQMRKLGYMDVGEDLQWGMVPTTAKPGDPALPPGAQPGDHLILWTDKQGGKHVQSATAIIRAGTKADVKVVPAEGSLAVTGPGRQPTLVQAPAKAPAQFKPETLDVYNNDGQKIGQRLINPNTKEVISSTVGAGGTGDGTAGRDVKKALPELKEATQEVLKIPGMATKSDPKNILDTTLVLTPEGQALMPRVEALVLANRALPAHTAILVAMNGTPGTDSNGSPVVQYGGKVYPLSSTGTRVTPSKGVDKAAILTRELKQNQANLATARAAGDTKKVEQAMKNIAQLQAELAKTTKPIRRPDTPIPTSELIGKKNGGKISRHHYGLGM